MNRAVNPSQRWGFSAPRLTVLGLVAAALFVALVCLAIMLPGQVYAAGLVLGIVMALYLLFVGLVIFNLRGFIAELRRAEQDTQRIRERAALPEHEHALLRTLIDNLPDIVFVNDVESRVVLDNAANRRFVGATSPDEVIGKTVADYYPPEQAALYLAQDRAIIETGVPLLNDEQVSLDREGNKQWFLVNKVPLYGGDGKITGIIGIARNITGRKRIEEELANERNLLRTVIDNVPDQIYVKDSASRIILANAACARVVDVESPQALIGKWDFDFYTPELAEQYYADEQKLIQSGQPMENQEALVVVAGSKKTIWVSATKVPLRDTDGRIIGLVGISRDITERKRIEEELAKERNLLRTVIDNVPDLIYVRDLDSRFVLVNNACMKFVGVESPDDLIGKTDFDFYAPDKAAEYFSAEQALMRSGVPIRNQDVFVALAETGHTMWVSATKVPLKDADGNITGLVGISRDITERKQTEQALAEERNLLRTVIDLIPDYIYVKDTESRFVLRNISGIELLGLGSPDDIIGKTDFDLFPRQTAGEFYAEERIIVETGHSIVSQEVQVTAQSGHTQWLLYTKVPLRDSTGKITGIVGISRDITERKEAEAQLRKLSRAVEQSPSAIVITNTRGTIEYANPQFTELTGYSLEELVGENPRISQSGLTPLGIYEELWDTILAGGEWRGELLNKRKNGELYWVFSSVSGIKDADGEITHFLSIQEDITERKQAEEALRQARDQIEYERAQLRAILDSMGEGVIYDENLQTRYINQALTRLTGYTLEEWRGYLHPLKPEMAVTEDFEALNRTIYDTVKRKGIWRGEMRMRRKDGTEFDAGLTSTEVVGSEGKNAGVVTIIRDISQEKALQEQKSRFVANASHELRTPITNLKTRLYLMRKQPEKMDYHLQIMDEVTARMQRLVEDMLDNARFERGLIPLQRQDVVLQDVIASVVEVQRAEAERKDIRLSCEMPSEPLHLFADPERISQVITNLVVNAINYTPEGGQVSVQVVRHQGRGEQGYAAISVQDTGMGIAPDMQEQVFQPFFRASQGISGGTGLGLSIVKEIVELHDGSIDVESQPGQGSRFRVTLALQQDTP